MGFSSSLFHLGNLPPREFADRPRLPRFLCLALMQWKSRFRCILAASCETLSEVLCQSGEDGLDGAVGAP
eukprot:5269601-Alexandrium_andersonii.AAC.1